MKPLHYDITSLYKDFVVFEIDKKITLIFGLKKTYTVTIIDFFTIYCVQKFIVLVLIVCQMYLKTTLHNI